ncbi:MAG TPA: phosphotransferase family protein [Stellaceae bacterium]|jgi:aminoglycoside phosphotransferase (APT) family kinase protein
MPRDLTVDRKLADFIATRTGGEVRALRPTPLLKGAVLRHWRLDLDLRGGRFNGSQCWVLRADGATPLGMGPLKIGMARAPEFALQRALFAAGMAVAQPLVMCCDESVIGVPFYLMRFLPGESDGAAIVAAGRNDALAAALGGELARLHALDLAPRLRFLLPPPADAAASRLAELARWIEADDDPHPIAQWALRWLARHQPPPAPLVLCHGDFRTGNYRVAEGKLAGVLDWDFAGWSDPDEDIAWFCAKPWRFGAKDRDAGGIAPREVFYRAYEMVAGRRIDPVRIHYWEVMAALRWLAIALKQRDRYAKQGERSLDLALTGRRVAECEHEILALTGLG